MMRLLFLLFFSNSSLFLPLSSQALILCVTVSLPVTSSLVRPHLPACGCPVNTFTSHVDPSILWRGFCIEALSLSTQTVRCGEDWIKDLFQQRSGEAALQDSTTYIWWFKRHVLFFKKKKKSYERFVL